MAGSRPCFACNGEMSYNIRNIPYTYKQHTIYIEQPGFYCEKCGECLLSKEDNDKTEKLIIKFRRDVDGLLHPEMIKDIRTSIGLSQAEAGQYFGGGSQAFSKYERGLITHSRALDILLRLLSTRRLSIEDIKNCCDNSKKPEVTDKSDERHVDLLMNEFTYGIAEINARKTNTPTSDYLSNTLENAVFKDADNVHNVPERVEQF